MFLPTTKKECLKLGWQQLDVILVTGDTYIDSPHIGIAVIGKMLVKAGYRVGIIAQPEINDGSDITRLGEPALFWGVTAGSVDSMVANRTASGKRRKSDDYTPGGVNDRRPDRATIVYSNLIRHYYKDTVPIILGGIEASLRRIAHYDFWSNKIRRSILFDAKANYLLYGMAEKAVLGLAQCLKENKSPHHVRGVCYISDSIPENCIEIPAFQETRKSMASFTKMFHVFYRNNDPLTASALAQKQDSRYLVQNPPPPYLSSEELDDVFNLEFENNVHPYYRKQGKVKALDTIQFSISTHRGCYGECNFCAIAVHEGRTVRWRSKSSILNEARRMTRHPHFKGVISDVGGPTANMYGFECNVKMKKGCCPDKRCLFPQICPNLPVDHSKQIDVLSSIRKLADVKKVFVASGIRHDMVLHDQRHGMHYLRDVVKHHVSGQMKIAPEHSEYRVLKFMGKPDTKSLLIFKELFYKFTKELKKEQYLTYYFIAAHPGCTDRDMQKLHTFVTTKLGLIPEQVQLFTPTPSTYATLMYYTQRDPFTGKPIFVERDPARRNRQKTIIRKKRNM